MGCAATSCLMFGVEVDQAQARELDVLLSVLAISAGACAADVKSGGPKDRLGVLGSPWESLSMRADNADSRVENVEWIDNEHPSEQRARYFFGFDLGSNGYGARDDIAALALVGPAPALLSLWEREIGPMLATIGFAAGEPSTRVVAQTW